MANPKKQIIDCLNELEELQVERDSLSAKQEKAIAKYRAEFERATAPILEKYNEKLSPVNQRIAALNKEVEAQMLMNLDAAGVPKLKTVSSESLTAEVVQSAVRREVGAETFFDAVPAIHRRGESFWSCLSVQIGKAEKFLGERINEIANFKQNFKVVIRPK